MGYAKIHNLYATNRPEVAMLFGQEYVYALEKIHGTSARVIWDGQHVRFFSGGADHEEFRALFDRSLLEDRFFHVFSNVPATIYGEAYGGKLQGMSKWYGDKLRFIAFDIKYNGEWVPTGDAGFFCSELAIDFVHVTTIRATQEAMDTARDCVSPLILARTNQEATGEGVVLRPLQVFYASNGERVCAKHKRPEFSERKNPPVPMSEEAKQVWVDAKAIAEEWVVPERVRHVLSKLGSLSYPEGLGAFLKALVADVEAEAGPSIVMTKEARKEISRTGKQVLESLLLTLKEN